MAAGVRRTGLREEGKPAGKQGCECRFHGLSIGLLWRFDGLRPTRPYGQRNRACQFIPVSVCYGFGFRL
jgi:hypothetical protein